VPVSIGRRPPRAAVGALPVAIDLTAIGDDEYQIISDLDGDIAEAAGCSCSAGDDQPY
jgi:hypothetical protein